MGASEKVAATFHPEPQPLSLILNVLAMDLEDMRVNGYELGTTTVGRVQSIARLAERVEASRLEIRKQAFRDAAIVFDHAAKAWEGTSIEGVDKLVFGGGYRQAHYALSKWAEDPSVIEGHLKREREEREGE